MTGFFNVETATVDCIKWILETVPVLETILETCDNEDDIKQDITL